MGVVLSTCTTKIAHIGDSGRKHRAAELAPCLPVTSGHSRDWASCTIVTIGLPDLVSTSGCESQAASLHPYIWLLPTEGQGALRPIAGQNRVWHSNAREGN